MCDIKKVKFQLQFLNFELILSSKLIITVRDEKKKKWWVSWVRQGKKERLRDM